MTAAQRGAWAHAAVALLSKKNGEHLPCEGCASTTNPRSWHWTDDKRARWLCELACVPTSNITPQGASL